MAEHLCPKCGGKLTYDTAEKLFVCSACGNRFYREVILGAAPENDDLRVYLAPQSSAEGDVDLPSQFEREAPAEMPPPPAVPSERLDAHVTPKPAKITRRTQRYMVRYDREREKRERDRLEAEAETKRWEANLSAEYRRANLKAIGNPAPRGVEETSAAAPAPLAGVAAPVPLIAPAPEGETVPPAENMPTRARLELALREAQLSLREKQQTLKRLSADIWRLERAPGQSRREFKNTLAEANREIDRAALAVKEAKLTVKEAKRVLKKAK